MSQGERVTVILAGGNAQDNAWKNDQWFILETLGAR